jgi:CheY-like chemotaxis protein
VEADAGMMEQVLMNLVVNARDAMPKGGCINISIADISLGDADIAVNPDRRTGHFVCLATSDTGSGMDEATMKRIFEPFFTTKEVGKGSGLGLATIHGIVAQHKGWIEVESTVGQGSIFRVYLPALIEQPERIASAPPEELPRGENETILLVEDDASLRRMIGQILRAFGYCVHSAANGKEALALWHEHGAQVNLLLTDMVMPEGITGLELAERLRKLKPDLKAIISSGYSSEIPKTGAIHANSVVYLPKPYEAKTLAEVVRNCLNAKT